MLWYKSWLETRYRLLFLLVLVGVMVSLQHNALMSMQSTAFKASPRLLSVNLTTFTTILTFLTFISMSGAGILTQTLRTRRGIHGSMLYTLALPVSRLRMLTVRAGMGWLQSVGMIGTICWTIWMLYPQFRAIGSPMQMAEHIGTLVACGSTLYCLSVLLATFLDDQGRAFGSMVAFFVMWWFSVHGQLPGAIDFMAAMGKNSPLITHTIPWTPIIVSLGLSGVLLFAALQVARLREY